MDNPFVIKAYESRELFCDREDELKMLIRNCTNSVSRRLADALCEKGLINDESTLEGTIYTVNDVFLSHWMERL